MESIRNYTAHAWPAGRLSVSFYTAALCLIEILVVFGSGVVTRYAVDAQGLALILQQRGTLGVPFTAAVTYAFLAAGMGAYPSRLLSPGDTQTASALQALFSACVALGLLHLTLDQPLTGLMGWVIAWPVMAGLAIVGLRYGLPLAYARLAPPAAAVRVAVLIGSGDYALHFLQAIERERPAGLRMMGCFDERMSRSSIPTEQLPYLGNVDGLPAYIAANGVTDVFIALPWITQVRIAHLLGQLRFLPITVSLISDEMVDLRAAAFDEISGVKMPTLMRPPMSPLGHLIKTSIDRSLGLLALIVLLPLFVAVALAIRLDTPGPVFFRQVRTGLFGKPFTIFKFRTLHDGQADPDATTLVSRGDSRVTKVGRWLRYFSLDEMPQLLNVVRGEMSLVGPRPHPAHAKADGKLYNSVIPDYSLRYRVKPGMTGWAQVNGWRGETDTVEKLSKRVEFDFRYIESWSLWLDFWIMILTIPAVLMPKNNA